MKLKTFRINDGRLEFVGIKEVVEGDCILEGSTKMTETIDIRESDSQLTEDENALRESFRNLHPLWTEAQLDIAVKGK